MKFVIVIDESFISNYSCHKMIDDIICYELCAKTMARYFIKIYKFINA